MKCIEVFKHRDQASEKQQALKDKGIEARVVVDPLEGRFPALSTFHDVVLMVNSEQFQEASTLLRKKVG
jgi:hypothetical protein